MTLEEEINSLANDYVSGRVTLPDVRQWLNEHLTTYADVSDDHPAAGLWGFMQVRVWEYDGGALPEPELREQVGEFLATEGLLRPPTKQRAG